MATTNQTCRDTVEKYIAMLNDDSKTGADFLSLYAKGATVEDPVGSQQLSDAAAIEAFYNAIPADRAATLLELRTVAGEAVFSFELTMNFPDHNMTIKPFDLMVINEDGKIASMRAFWSDEDIAFG
ncbi:MAG: nuclear transport factor 2 family protein [Nocardioidaceae bacterium]|nr:nuclear transport factor 2 family protein [Marmoricola sp.]